MRKLLCFAFLFFSAFAFGQTVTVSGHTITGQNGTSSSGISILWELTNDGGQQCKVAGTGLLTPMSFSVTQAQLAAGIAMFPNSGITCGTTLGASRWRYTIKANGVGTRQCSLNITGATNLDSTACLNATSTPVTVTPTDSIYCRIDASNCGFTGTPTAPVFNAATGFQVASGATSGNVLRGNGTNFVSSPLAAADLSNGVTGSGAAVLATSPSLTTPNIGAATGTSLALGGGTALTTTNRTGTGNLVLATAPTVTNSTQDTINQPAATAFTIKDNQGGTRLSIPSGGVAASTLNNTDITGGSTLSGTIPYARLKASRGTALVTGDIGSITNFGTTASVSAVSGTDSAGTISIASAGTGQVANGSFVLTFHDGTWTTAPVCIGNRAEGNGPNTATVATSTSATTLAFNFDGAAVAGVTYIFNFICVGKP